MMENFLVAKADIHSVESLQKYIDFPFLNSKNKNDSSSWTKVSLLICRNTEMNLDHLLILHSPVT